MLLAARTAWDRPAPWRFIVVHASAGLIAALLQAGVFAVAFFPLYGPPNGHQHPGQLWMGMIAAHLPSNLLIYAALVAVRLTFAVRDRAREREAHAAALEARLVQAELSALRAQLQPHFLFNTLNGVSALIAEDPTAAQRMVARLGDLLRMTLDGGEAAEAPLAREAAFLEAYLEIERVRYPRLTAKVEIDPAAADALIPPLLLQPLVENAIRHGLAPLARAGVLTVTARRQGQRLLLEVADDGAGAAAIDPRIGLSNTRERLAQTFGGDHGFEIVTAPDEGFRVRLDLPYRAAP